MNIAILGLGRMGSGMAARLAKTGEHKLAVWNRTPGKMLPLAELGARAAADPAEAVYGAELVITSLMDDNSVEALFSDQGATLPAMHPGAIHLCVTTISPGCASRLEALHAAHGGRYVSGPVVGRPDAAAAGKLVQFLAGDPSAVTAVEPVCRTFAEQVMRLPGPASAANSQKLCVNFFVAALIEVMGECFTLGEKLGVPRESLAFFMGKCLPLPGIKVYVEKILKRETDSGLGFTMNGGRKDLTLMLDAAASVQCPVDIATVIADKLDDAIAQSMGDLDWSAIQEITRQRAGLCDNSSQCLP
jgi:3-hydroxyisobutyrate dehydrogenase-like beta-hydroxyacid dehydrogenase